MIEKEGEMVPICCGRELSLSIRNEVIEATKPAASKWRTYINGMLSASISTSALVTVGAGITINDVIAAMQGADSIQFICKHSATQEAFFSGKLLFTDLSITGNYKEAMAESLTAIVDGPISTTNPYETVFIVDSNGDFIVDENGDFITEQLSGDLPPITIEQC